MQSNKKIDVISTILLYAAPVAGVGMYCLVQKEDIISVFSKIAITLIVAGIYSTFLHINQNYFYQKITNPLLYFGSLFLSFILLGGSAGIPLGIFWMLAVVFAAMSSGMELAISTHAVLMVQYALLILPKDDGFYRFLAYILLGIVMSLLFSQLKEKKAVPYLALILAACDGVLQCVVHQFNLVKMNENLLGIMVEFISILIFVGIGFVYLQKFALADAVVAENAGEAEEEAVEADVVKTSEDIKEAEVSEMAEEAENATEALETSEETENAAEALETSEEAENVTEALETSEETENAAEALEISEEAENVTEALESSEEVAETEGLQNVEADFDLQQVTTPGYELLERLRAYSEVLYSHSERISLLSEKAAAAIGGNTELAKAAGMYHELGRMEDESDYIEAGTRLGKAYGFSEELLSVMRQHSTGFELPKSAEAAIVMLSDCIISTSDFLAKSGKREKISDRKLVTSIFQNRLDKGNLEESGMTEEQIQTLKEFYIENTFGNEE